MNYLYYEFTISDHHPNLSALGAVSPSPLPCWYPQAPEACGGHGGQADCSAVQPENSASLGIFSPPHTASPPQEHTFLEETGRRGGEAQKWEEGGEEMRRGEKFRGGGEKRAGEMKFETCLLVCVYLLESHTLSLLLFLYFLLSLLFLLYIHVLHPPFLWVSALLPPLTRRIDRQMYIGWMYRQMDIRLLIWTDGQLYLCSVDQFSQ